jgi:hypothetical protein
MSAQSHEYEVVATPRVGAARSHSYASDVPLGPGDVLRLEGRFWLVTESEPPRLVAVPARYRIRLRHPDAREELGALRRYRPGAPRVEHTFTTIEGGQPVAWEVEEANVARDDDGEPYLDLVAERDYDEAEALPDHELEHALEARDDDPPDSANAVLASAADAGLAIELAALEPGERPDWEAARRYIDDLISDEVGEDVIAEARADPSRPPGAWLEAVKERLRADLDSLRADVEGAHDQIEEWDFRGGRVFAAVGPYEGESDPDTGYGWLVRLLDSGALGAAGFHRERKATLDLFE